MHHNPGLGCTTSHHVPRPARFALRGAGTRHRGLPTMSDDLSAIPARLPSSTADGRWARCIDTLGRPPVAVALLVTFTLLVGILCQGLFTSIDEGFQYGAALHPIPYIVIHDPQNQPFYGVL